MRGFFCVYWDIVKYFYNFKYLIFITQYENLLNTHTFYCYS